LKLGIWIWQYSWRAWYEVG